jgi:hypothetical protein
MIEKVDFEDLERAINDLNYAQNDFKSADYDEHRNSAHDDQVS